MKVQPAFCPVLPIQLCIVWVVPVGKVYSTVLENVVSFPPVMPTTFPKAPPLIWALNMLAHDSLAAPSYSRERTQIREQMLILQVEPV